METLCLLDIKKNLKNQSSIVKSVWKELNLLNQEVVFCDQSGVVVRNSQLSDIEHLKYCLKQADVNEVWASHHFTPFQALYDGWQKSLICLTILRYSTPVAIVGVNPESFFSKNAVIWFLSSDLLDTISIRFLKNSRRFVDMFLEYYSYLHNYVDSRNEKTIKWLEFMGAVIEPSQPYGADGCLFHHFYFKK